MKHLQPFSARLSQLLQHFFLLFIFFGVFIVVCVLHKKQADLLTVLGDDGLHCSHVGGLHHERDSLSLSDLHHSLEHHGIVVA